MEVLHSSYTMCTHGLLDIYTLSLWAYGPWALGYKSGKLLWPMVLLLDVFADTKGGQMTKIIINFMFSC